MPYILKGSGTATALANSPAYRNNNTGFAAEADAQSLVRLAGTADFVFGRFDNVGTARSIKLRKNSADGNLAVSFSDTTEQTAKDTSHSDHFAVGDAFNFKLDWATAAPTAYTVGTRWLADAGHSVQVLATTAQIPNTATAQYRGLTPTSGSTSETAGQITNRSPGTLTNFFARVSGNGVAANSTINFRKASANANSVLTITASTTGYFEDTTHSDALADGNIIGIRSANGNATGTLTFLCGATIDYSTNANDVSSTGTGVFPTTGFMPTHFASLSGLLATEASAEITHGFRASVDQARVRLNANPNASVATFQLRKNAGNAAVVVTVAGSATGLFQDTTHSDTFEATDAMCWSISSAGSGTVTLSHLALRETTLAAPSPAWWHVHEI